MNRQLAVVPRAGNRPVIEGHIVRDVEIEVPVVVVVGERAARSPPRLVEARAAGHVGERALPGVSPERIGAERGDVDVAGAVVVVITDAGARAPSAASRSRWTL